MSLPTSDVGVELVAGHRFAGVGSDRAASVRRLASRVLGTVGPAVVVSEEDKVRIAYALEDLASVLSGDCLMEGLE